MRRRPPETQQPPPETTTALFSTKSEAEMEVGKDFFASQVEREQLIAEKTAVFFSDRVRRPLSKKNHGLLARRNGTRRGATQKTTRLHT
jgi:malate synthase